MVAPVPRPIGKKKAQEHCVRWATSILKNKNMSEAACRFAAECKFIHAKTVPEAEAAKEAVASTGNSFMKRMWKCT